MAKIELQKMHSDVYDDISNQCRDVPGKIVGFENTGEDGKNSVSTLTVTVTGSKKISCVAESLTRIVEGRGQKIEILDNALDQAEQANAALQKENVALKDVVTEFRDSNRKLQFTVYDREQEIGRLRIEKKALEGRIAQLKSDLQASRSENLYLRMQISSLEDQYKAITESLRNYGDTGDSYASAGTDTYVQRTIVLESNSSLVTHAPPPKTSGSGSFPATIGGAILGGLAFGPVGLVGGALAGYGLSQ